jgi:hypothetical protein
VRYLLSRAESWRVPGVIGELATGYEGYTSQYGLPRSRAGCRNPAAAVFRHLLATAGAREGDVIRTTPRWLCCARCPISTASPPTGAGSALRSTACGRTFATGSTCPAEAWHFSATDGSSAGRGDDYKYLTQALVRRDGRTLFMTVLANVEPEAVKASALGMLRGFGCKPAAAATATRAFELALPDRSWALELDLAGYDIRQRGETEAGGRMLMASNDDLGVTLSAFVEPVDDKPSAPECRKRIWKGGFENEADADVRMYERGEMALGEYSLAAGRPSPSATERLLGGAGRLHRRARVGARRPRHGRGQARAGARRRPHREGRLDRSPSLASSQPR